MPYLFVSDGNPEARDDDANYIWYDPDDAESLARARRELSRRLRVPEHSVPSLGASARARSHHAS